jgi:hypothetical protein
LKVRVEDAVEEEEDALGEDEEDVEDAVKVAADTWRGCCGRRKTSSVLR